MLIVLIRLTKINFTLNRQWSIGMFREINSRQLRDEVRGIVDQVLEARENFKSW